MDKVENFLGKSLVWIFTTILATRSSWLYSCKEIRHFFLAAVWKNYGGVTSLVSWPFVSDLRGDYRKLLRLYWNTVTKPKFLHHQTVSQSTALTGLVERLFLGKTESNWNVVNALLSPLSIIVHTMSTIEIIDLVCCKLRPLFGSLYLSQYLSVCFVSIRSARFTTWSWSWFSLFWHIFVTREGWIKRWGW